MIGFTPRQFLWTGFVAKGSDKSAVHRRMVTLPIFWVIYLILVISATVSLWKNVSRLNETLTYKKQLKRSDRGRLPPSDH
jgi:hypothetical protein